MDGLSFTAVFAAIYALECLVWVPRHGLAFVRGLFGGFRVAGPGLHLKSVLPGGAALPLAPPPDWRLAPPRHDNGLAQRLQAYQDHAGALYWPGRMLLLIVALMLGLWHLGPGPGRNEAWLGLLGLTLLVHLSAVILLARRWRRVLPDARGRARALAIASVSPWASARVADLLGRELLQGVHPAAAAVLLLEPDDRRNFAARCLRDAEHPLPGEAPDVAGWKAWAAAQGWRAEELLAPPQPQPHSHAYCPRCLVQYAAARPVCSDCGVELRHFGGDAPIS